MKTLKTVSDAEREIILKALIKFEGNRSHAAKAVGISIRTMRNKIQQYKRDGFQVHEPIHSGHWKGTHMPRSSEEERAN